MSKSTKKKKMKTLSAMKYVGIAILILFAGVGVLSLISSESILVKKEPRSFGDPTNPRISYEGEPSSRTLLPYTENYNVPFDYEGRIDYDLLIKKLLPHLFQDKLLFSQK